MKKFSGFTLIELLVTIFIIGLLTAISFPALASYQKRAKNLDTSTQLTKDAILATQNLAFAPTDVNADYYVLIIDLSGKHYDVYRINKDGSQTIPKQNINLSGNFSMTSETPADLSFLKIAFRVSDGRPGFGVGDENPALITWPEDTTNWGSLFPGSGDHADLKLQEIGGTGVKNIIIQNITGVVNVE